MESPLTDPPRSGQPPYNGQHNWHRLILACVLYIFNLRERDSCNLSVPDNGHSASTRMIVAVQKKPLRADRLKATPSRTRQGVAPRAYRGYYGVVSTFYRTQIAQTKLLRPLKCLSNSRYSVLRGKSKL